MSLCTDVQKYLPNTYKAQIWAAHTKGVEEEEAYKCKTLLSGKVIDWTKV